MGKKKLAEKLADVVSVCPVKVDDVLLWAGVATALLVITLGYLISKKWNSLLSKTCDSAFNEIDIDNSGV